MDFEIKDSPKIKVGILGKEYFVEELNVEQLEKLDKEIKSRKGEEISVMTEALESMGLPQDVVKKLKQSQFESLCKFLLSDKKKLVSAD